LRRAPGSTTLDAARRVDAGGAMLFGWWKRLARTPPQDPAAEARRLTVERLERLAAEDAARAAAASAERVDEERRTRGAGRLERLTPPAGSGPVPDLDAEIDAAIERLGPDGPPQP
jgi:hypothetical protein